MRHLWLLLMIGCGGGTSGEPLMGTVTLGYGGDNPKMKVGTAVQHQDSPNNMLIQIGSDNVDCDTYLDVFLDFDAPSGSFIYFDVAKNVASTSGSVSVMKSSSRNISINSGPGNVTITAIEPRVTGMVTFATTDEEVGMITVAGTFDVKRCF
jgi:hypothetical protein